MKTTDVPINNPCNEDWDAMSGGRKRRHCGSCDKDVFHLSNMTRAEADELLATRDSSICVRYTHDADGNLYFRDSTFGGRLDLQWEGLRKLVAAAALVVPGLGLVACDTQQAMGDIAPPQHRTIDYRPHAQEPPPVTVTIIDGEAPRIVARPSPGHSPYARPVKPHVVPLDPPRARMGRRAAPIKKMGEAKPRPERYEMMGDVAAIE
jgi:hypothetical protein